MSYTPISNHAARGIARLTHVLKDKPRVAAWLGALLKEVQTLEDAIEVLRQRSLADSIGAQLDKWGRRLKQPRRGLSDDAYRFRLQARLAVNRSSGTIPELLNILALLAGQSRDRHVIEHFPMGLELIAGGNGVDLAEATEWKNLLNEARMAAVYVTLQWNTADEDETLTLNSSLAGQRLNEGKLAYASII